MIFAKARATAAMPAAGTSSGTSLGVLVLRRADERFRTVRASVQRGGAAGRRGPGQAVKKASAVQQTAASPAATEACGICVFTWSIRSQPVHTELSTVVSEMGEH